MPIQSRIAIPSSVLQSVGILEMGLQLVAEGLHPGQEGGGRCRRVFDGGRDGLDDFDGGQVGAGADFVVGGLSQLESQDLDLPGDRGVASGFGHGRAQGRNPVELNEGCSPVQYSRKRI